MNNFSDLLATEFNLDVNVNGVTQHRPLREAMTFNTGDCVTVDGIEVLPRYAHLALDNQLHIDRPFYQWLHSVSGQGWLLKPHENKARPSSN